MTLQIQKSDERNRVVLTLIGRIRADQVSELEALLTPVTDYDSVVLDLKDVRLLDRDAVLFLARTETAGAKLRNCSAFDMAGAIVDRVLERGRFIHLDGSSGRTRQLRLEEPCFQRLNGSELPELAGQNFRNPQAAHRE